jgi:outer membrane protein assembly factor BamD
MKKFSFCLIPFFVALLFSCAGEKSGLKEGESNGDELFAKGKAYYEIGKYGKAAKQFTEFVYSYPFSEKIAEGTFLLAESYYKDEQYELAVVEFRRIAQRYTDTDYAERAELMVGEALLAGSPRVQLEQEQTQNALQAFKDFITYHPSSENLLQARDGVNRCREKLAEKEYRSELLYFKAKKPESVVLYADLIAEEYDSTSWVPKAKLLKGRALSEQLDKKDDAVIVFEEIIKDFPGTESAAQAAKKLAKIKG